MKMSPVSDEMRRCAMDKRYLRLMGRYINELRMRRGLSQKELADKAGLSRTEIHNIEHGLTGEKVTTLRRVCEALGVAYGEVVAHTDYAMDHPEWEPPHTKLKTWRGIRRVNVHSIDGDRKHRV